MKKILALILLLSTTLALFACSAPLGDGDTTTTTGTPYEIIYDTMARYNCKDGKQYDKALTEESAAWVSRHNGFELGADDYIAKPFHTDELLARIKALLRRKEKFTGNVLAFNDIALDRDSFELIKGEKRIALGKKEFQILEMLMLNNGKSIDKERFIEKIWGFDTDAEYNTIEVYVSFLRKKLFAVGSKTEIKSLRGIGYTLGEKK